MTYISVKYFSLSYIWYVRISCALWPEKRKTVFLKLLANIEPMWQPKQNFFSECLEAYSFRCVNIVLVVRWAVVQICDTKHPLTKWLSFIFFRHSLFDTISQYQGDKQDSFQLVFVKVAVASNHYTKYECSIIPLQVLSNHYVLVILVPTPQHRETGMHTSANWSYNYTVLYVVIIS